MRYFLILFIGTSFCFSQSLKTERLKKLCINYVALDSGKEYDSISKLIFDFQSNKDLNILENQVMYFFKGNLNSRIENFDSALENYKKSITYKYNSNDSERTYAFCLFYLSDLYFTKKKYTESKNYALLSVPYIKEEYYFEYINVYSILGYCEFLEKDYKNSLIHLKKAQSFIVSKKDDCKLPEVEMKLAQLYDAMDDYDLALKTINNAVQVAKKCNYQVIEKNARTALIKILKKHNKLNAIIKENDSVKHLDESLKLNERNLKIDALETKYKTKLKEQENKSLKIIGKEKDKVVAKQQFALFITVTAILVFALLLFLLYLLSKKQKQTNKELNRLNILNQKIFSVISHDFKGPITTLKMMLSNPEIIKIENAQVAAYINDINLQLEQSDGMLNNLLDWAKTELKIQNSTTSILNLKEISDVVIYQLQVKSNEKNISIYNNVTTTEINFPPQILTIVLRNIINNAIKFSFENAKIEVYFQDNALHIKDAGKGIEPKKLGKLFKQNINPGLGTKFETGFGMGLYLSNELMLKNKGRLSAINNLDKGITFSIHFP